MENYTHLWISSPNSKSAARNANRFAERTVWHLIGALRLCKRLDQLVAASLRARGRAPGSQFRRHLESDRYADGRKVFPLVAHRLMACGLASAEGGSDKAASVVYFHLSVGYYSNSNAITKCLTIRKLKLLRYRGFRGSRVLVRGLRVVSRVFAISLFAVTSVVGIPCTTALI
jgi:hypothetical protein